MLRSIFRRLQTNARKYSCLSSKREWEKTGGKSVFSFLGSVPTLTTLLASLNFCFHISQEFASNVFAIRLIPNGRSQPTRLQLACPAPTGTICQPIKLAAMVHVFERLAKTFRDYFSSPFCLYTECIKKIARKSQLVEFCPSYQQIACNITFYLILRC